MFEAFRAATRPQFMTLKIYLFFFCFIGITSLLNFSLKACNMKNKKIKKAKGF